MALPVPGLLYVPLLQDSMTDPELDNWYNNQHSPARMCYRFFTHGARYKQVLDLSKSHEHRGSEGNTGEKLALYDISDMHELDRAPYVTLLAPSVQGRRDKDSICKVTASRKYFDHVVTYSAIQSEKEKWLQSDNIPSMQGIVAVVRVHLSSSTIEAQVEFERWYREDHVPPLRKVPGWRRSRIYRTSFLERDSGEFEYLTVNEFADPAQIGGAEHMIAIRAESRTTVVTAKTRQYWKPEIVLGGGPKDLHSLAALGRETADYTSPDGFIHTANDRWPVIESSVSTGDTGLIEYRLEGYGSSISKIIAVGTVSGLHWDIWDQLVCSIMEQRSDVRVLRVKLNLTPQLRNLPLTSGEAYLQLETCVRAVLDELVLPPAMLLLGLGIAGDTVGRRFETYCIQDGTKFERPHSPGCKSPTPMLKITARSRLASEIIISQLITVLRNSQTVVSWARNISDELVGNAIDFCT